MAINNMWRIEMAAIIEIESSASENNIESGEKYGVMAR